MAALCKALAKCADIGLSIMAVCKNIKEKTLGQDVFFVVRLTSLACQESYGLQLASGNDMLMLILVSKTGNCNLDDIDALDKLFSLWHELKS